MDAREIFQDEFFVKLQRELEDRQEQLTSILNPNEYLVAQAKIELLKNVIESYVSYLVPEGKHDGKEDGSK